MPPKKKKHKKRAYKKSRYYRRRQQITERLLIGCGAVLILLLLIILVRGCSARKNGAIKTNASAKSQDETSASDADLTPDDRKRGKCVCIFYQKSKRRTGEGDRSGGCA